MQYGSLGYVEIKGAIRITGICGDGAIRITGICGDKGYNKDHWDMWR